MWIDAKQLVWLLPATYVAALYWEIAKGVHVSVIYLPLQAAADVLLAYYVVLLYVVPGLVWLIILRRARPNRSHGWGPVLDIASAPLVMNLVLIVFLVVAATGVLEGLTYDRNSSVAFFIVLPVAFGTFVAWRRRAGTED